MNKKTISVIVAAAENGAIGKNNDLLWHLPSDMAYFKKTTLGKPVIMGRKNYESIPQKFRPLPNRVNIVVSRNLSYKVEGCILTESVENAIEYAKTLPENEIFIIGGAEIYAYCLKNNYVDKIYFTLVHTKLEGDAFFPEIKEDEWRLVSSRHNQADDNHAYPFDFKIYERI